MFSFFYCKEKLEIVFVFDEPREPRTEGHLAINAVSEWSYCTYYVPHYVSFIILTACRRLALTEKDPPPLGATLNQGSK